MKRYFLIIGIIAGIIAAARLYPARSAALPADVVDLGRQLFFDSILSLDHTISCASCHKPEFAFADTVAFSAGVFQRKGSRNTPSAMNVASADFFFWDGRAASLEQQALFPIANPMEMALPVDSAVQRLRGNEYYNRAFQKLFGERPSSKTLATALSRFEASMETADTPFDDWKTNDREDAVSQSAQRGFLLFNGTANCSRCHFGTDFNNSEFRNIGLFNGKELKDSGRAAITGQTDDLGKFKIGPLRNVALTAPYMHNGMFSTLREVIDYYNDPDKRVPDAINRDSLLSNPLHLSERDKDDLENFLLSLTSRSLKRGELVRQ
jgi:cytochrome c peroxidase